VRKDGAENFKLGRNLRISPLAPAAGLISEQKNESGNASLVAAFKCCQ